jgi:dipeptidyl aminopeptidase/acylaminoacyl peptidase
MSYNPRIREGKMVNKRPILVAFGIAISILSCALPEQIGDNATDRIATEVAEQISDLQETHLPPANVTSIPTLDPTEEPVLPPPFRVVYTDGGNIWMIEEGNLPVQLTFDGGVERVLISPDGAKVVYTRGPSPEEGHELRTVNTDGSAEMQLLSFEQVANIHPLPDGVVRFEIGMMAFKPSTHILYFNTIEFFDGPGLLKSDDIYTLDVDSGDLAVFLPADSGGDFHFSPDGTQLIVVRPESIDLINADGSDHMVDLLIYPPVTTYSEFRYYAQPVWAIDSSVFGVAISSPEPLEEGIFGTISTVPAEGGLATERGIIEGDFYFTQVFSAASISPNLDRVAFIRESDGERRLYLANLDGSNVTLVDTGVITWESWSPDGEHFAFTQSQPTNVVITTPNGTKILEVPAIDFRWTSSDEFAFLWGTRGDWTLKTGTLDGFINILADPIGDFISFDFVGE